MKISRYSYDSDKFTDNDDDVASAFLGTMYILTRTGDPQFEITVYTRREKINVLGQLDAVDWASDVTVRRCRWPRRLTKLFR